MLCSPPPLSGPGSRFSEPPRPDSASLLCRRRRPRAGRSHPRLSGSDSPAACRFGDALRSCPRSHTRPRGGTATRGGAPRLSAPAHARTRPQAPSQPQASDSRAARGTQRPIPQPTRRHSLTPPLLHCDKRSPSVSSLKRRGGYNTLMRSPLL